MKLDPLDIECLAEAIARHLASLLREEMHNHASDLSVELDSIRKDMLIQTATTFDAIADEIRTLSKE